MAYSEDLRSRVMSAVDGGMSKKEAAERFGVSRAIVYIWDKTPEKTRAAKPGPKGCSRLDLPRLKTMISERPSAYQYELAEILGVSQRTVGRGLAKLNFSRKKNETLSGEKRRKSQYVPG